MRFGDHVFSQAARFRVDRCRRCCLRPFRLMLARAPPLHPQRRNSPSSPAAGTLCREPILVYAMRSALSGAAVLVSFIRIERVASPREPISVAVLFAGVNYIRHNPIILGAISLDLFAVILGSATALLPVFASDVFNMGPEGLGLLRAAPGAGALVVALVMTRWPPRRHVGRIMFGSVAVFGAAVIVFAMSRSFELSMIALCVLGSADMASVVIRMAHYN